jgi:acetoin utilization deacetylase AcuC-like enzyme
MTTLSIDQPTRRARAASNLVMVRQRGGVIDGDTPWLLDDGGSVGGQDGRRRVSLVEAGLRRHPAVRGVGSGATDADVERTLYAIHDLEYLVALHDPEPSVSVSPEHVASAGEAVRTAISAARHVARGARLVYALCRSPGHLAGPRFLGNHCYLNTAAAAAYTLCQAGSGPVGILDLDLHYPNGTSAIVAGMDDIVLHSLHAGPITTVPADAARPRTGRERLVEFRDTPEPETYLDAVDESLDVLTRAARVLVVSLGYDTVAGDPYGTWDFDPGIFAAIGGLLAARGLPVCVVQEGGYALDVLADCSGALASGLLAEASATAL